MVTDSEVAVADEGTANGCVRLGHYTKHRSPCASAGRAVASVKMALCCVLLLAGNCSYGQDTRRVAEPQGDPGTTLRRGSNEFGGWIGYSPFSFVLKGTSKDRELFLLNLQYARTLFVARPFTLKYTVDVVPLALEFQPTQLYLVGGQPLLNPGGTLRAAGANPIGFQANLGSRRVQPFASGSLGFLYFNRQMPVIGSSQLNYNITIGFGAQFFAQPGRSFTVGWKYHHLSNNYEAHFNPGLDSGVFYLGFSLFHARRASH